MFNLLISAFTNRPNKDLKMRAYNFSAGPAILPEEVLQQAQAEFVDYQSTGMSIMEMSHREKNTQPSMINHHKY